MTILTPDQAGGILLGMLFISIIATGLVADWIRTNTPRVLRLLRASLALCRKTVKKITIANKIVNQ